MSDQRHPVSIHLVGVIQKEEAKLYMTMVLWSDQNEVTVYRSLEDFKKLNKSLKKKFPPANPFKRAERIIPKFKAGRVYQNGQIKSSNRSVLKLKALEEYCSELLKSDPRICQSSELINFLLPKAQDLNSDFSKNCIVIMPPEVTLGSNKNQPNSVTQPFVTETFRCVATYETKDTKNQPFKVEVDETVEVLIKDQKGWWLVEDEAKHMAWFPAPYLERADMGCNGPDEMDNGTVFHVAAKSYKATNSDEISVEIGSVVEVLQKSDNGWWIVRCNQKAGYMPSMYLQPYNDPRVRLNANKREKSSSTLNMAKLAISLQDSNRELSRSQGNLNHLTGRALHPAHRRMSRSLGLILNATMLNLTTLSNQVEEEESGNLSSLSDLSGEFSDDSSYSGSDSLSRSDAKKQRRLRSQTSDSTSSLNYDGTGEGQITPKPRVPPRPQTQEILSRCTTITCKNLQRTC